MMKRLLDFLPFVGGKRGIQCVCRLRMRMSFCRMVESVSLVGWYLCVCVSCSLLPYLFDRYTLTFFFFVVLACA